MLYATYGVRALSVITLSERTTSKSIATGKRSIFKKTFTLMVLLFDRILACDTFLTPLILSIVTNIYLVILLVLFIQSSVLLLIWTSSRLISLQHRLSFNPVIKSPLYFTLCHTNYVQSPIFILYHLLPSTSEFSVIIQSVH
jgi:hypothetical protein